MVTLGVGPRFPDARAAGGAVVCVAGAGDDVHPGDNSRRLLGEPTGIVMTNALWESPLHPDDIDIGTQIDDAIDHGRDYRVRYRQLHSDGDFIWIS